MTGVHDKLLISNLGQKLAQRSVVCTHICDDLQHESKRLSSMPHALLIRLPCPLLCCWLIGGMAQDLTTVTLVDGLPSSNLQCTLVKPRLALGTMCL